MNQEFNNWWDNDLLTEDNPFVDSTPAFWAWEGWCAKAAQQKPVCGWQREDDDHMPDTWRSDCGVLWTFSDGGPTENDMKHCCGCGAKLQEQNK